ncbi:glycosyltransferase [Agromyces aureus]|uniref:glycosyltransferase n=1 Tax=Agromyces aureus TaxID=453304 RepID=UPI0013747D2C|nr:glycosyltransferase [Agromyces aureus]
MKAIQDRDAWSQRLTDQDHDVLANLPDEFILSASRFVRYKRLEDAIRIGEITRIPVVIAGSGPDSRYLRQAAERSAAEVRFVDQPSDWLLYALYERALVFVFTAIEDFGIMPVEAMAAGTPVIVNAIGGAREPVEMLGGGAVLRDDSEAGIQRALKDALSTDRDALRMGVQAFDVEEFDANVVRWREASIA